MKQTAVEWLMSQMLAASINIETEEMHITLPKDVFKQAKAMEKKQLFLAYNTSAKEAYKAGQETMNCGCYEILDATTYEEWLYEQFKSE